jgi:flagellar basal body-associated protein FliL
MKMKLWIAALMTSFLVLGNGCALMVVGAAAGAGVAGYAWVDGEIQSTEAASLSRTWNATLAALKDLEFPVVSQTKDALEGNVTARNAKNTTIKIKLKYVSKTATEIRIRVGTFGDESLSHTILDKINSHLQSGS